MENPVEIKQVQQKQGSGAFKWIAGGAVGALLIANGVLFHRVGTLETDLSSQRTTQQAQLTEIQQATASSKDAVSRDLNELTAQLQEGTKTVTAAAQRAATKAKADAQREAEKLVAQVKEDQQAREEQITTSVNKQIGEVKSATEEQTAKVTGLETNIGTVQQTVGTIQEDAAKTRSTVDKTLADLKSMQGDLGVHSGLIATNAKELSALRELGERNYYEFTVQKGKPIKVASMTLDLKKADTKHNKYNVDVMADDKRVEKKDKTINEPVQMFVAGNRIPTEIVVNEVKKDTIVGYISVPKANLRASR